MACPGGRMDAWKSITPPPRTTSVHGKPSRARGGVQLPPAVRMRQALTGKDWPPSPTLALALATTVTATRRGSSGIGLAAAAGARLKLQPARTTTAISRRLIDA